MQVLCACRGSLPNGSVQKPIKQLRQALEALLPLRVDF